MGNNLGVQFDHSEREIGDLFAEGLGAFVFSLDPHHVEEVSEAFEDVERLGVVMKPAQLRWEDGYSFDLEQLRQSYGKLAQSGFWL